MAGLALQDLGGQFEDMAKTTLCGETSDNLKIEHLLLKLNICYFKTYC